MVGLEGSKDRSSIDWHQIAIIIIVVVIIIIIVVVIIIIIIMFFFTIVISEFKLDTYLNNIQVERGPSLREPGRHFAFDLRRSYVAATTTGVNCLSCQVASSITSSAVSAILHVCGLKGPRRWKGRRVSPEM